MRTSLLREVVAIGVVLTCAEWVSAQPEGELRNLNSLESDLVVPDVSDGTPAAGKRVRQQNPGYDGWDLCHVLYLPPDWKAGGKYPVLVEYPGNGGYENLWATAARAGSRTASSGSGSPAAGA